MKTKKIRAKNETKRKNVISCLFVAFIILFFSDGVLEETHGTQTSPFPDVCLEDWFGEAVIRAEGEGILRGYPDGSFRPDNMVTYGEFLRMAIKNAPNKGQRHWADSYYDEGIRRRLFKEGEISKGALDKAISRKYMALVFAGLLNEAGVNTKIQTGEEAESESMLSETSFNIDSRSAFKPFIEQSVAVGILTGYPDRTFRPENFLTRAEAAVAFVRLSDVLAAAAATCENSDSVNKTPQADSDAARSIEGVMEPAYKAYLDSILNSLRVSGSAGNYSYSFDVLEAPGESDVFFKVVFFSKTGAQILIDQTYISKDSSPRTINNSIKGLHSLSAIGIAAFDFGIKSRASGYWHDYMLLWKSNNILSLRAGHWHEDSNTGFSKYSTRALDYVFSWQ